MGGAWGSPGRWQRGRAGAGGRPAPPRGAGAAAGPHPVHQAGAAVALPRLQECESGRGQAGGVPAAPGGVSDWCPPAVPSQECPSGLVDEETFKLIYAQFFPQGGESGGGHTWDPPQLGDSGEVWHGGGGGVTVYVSPTRRQLLRPLFVRRFRRRPQRDPLLPGERPPRGHPGATSSGGVGSRHCGTTRGGGGRGEGTG